MGITKAGNTHVRRLLVEAAQGYGRGRTGHKSKALKARQQGNPPEVIAYADKANERLRGKYYKMVLSHGKKANVAKTAVVVLVYKCGQKKVNSLYYQVKEQSL